MKNILKSLLITSVLTLSAVLGSDDDNENPRNAASGVQSPLLDIETITNLINNASYLPLQKDVCLERASKGVLPNATLSDVWDSATFFILESSIQKIVPSGKSIMTWLLNYM